MKFVSYLLEDVAGIQVYYIVGLFIFISFFLVVLYRTYKMPKSEAEEISHFVFDDDELIQNQRSKATASKIQR